MIAFIIPIKPKNVSKNWKYDNLLWERTLKSVCAQKDKNFKVFVVYTDIPELNYAHSNIHFVYFPYKMVPALEILDLDYVKQHYALEYAEKMMDKSKKIMYGCNQGIQFGCDYFMGLDSDDLVSNQLVSYINNYKGKLSSGWRIMRGYVYEEGNVYLTKENRIEGICGSSHILHKILISIPDFNENRLWNFNLFESHGYLYNRVKQYYNVVLDDYPFFGIVYVAHQNNYSNILSKLNRVSIKNIIKKLIRFKYLSNKLKDEFGIYKLSTIN